MIFRLTCYFLGRIPLRYLEIQIFKSWTRPCLRTTGVGHSKHAMLVDHTFLIWVSSWKLPSLSSYSYAACMGTSNWTLNQTSIFEIKIQPGNICPSRMNWSKHTRLATKYELSPNLAAELHWEYQMHGCRDMKFMSTVQGNRKCVANQRQLQEWQNASSWFMKLMSFWVSVRLCLQKSFKNHISMPVVWMRAGHEQLKLLANQSTVDATELLVPCC